MTSFEHEILKGIVDDNKSRPEDFPQHDFQRVCLALQSLHDHGYIKAIFMASTNEIRGYVAACVLNVYERGLSALQD